VWNSLSATSLEKQCYQVVLFSFSSNSKIDNVNSKIESLDSNVMEGFQDLHDFGSRRAALLENISRDIVICDSRFTGHIADSGYIFKSQLPVNINESPCQA